MEDVMGAARMRAGEDGRTGCGTGVSPVYGPKARGLLAERSALRAEHGRDARATGLLGLLTVLAWSVTAGCSSPPKEYGTESVVDLTSARPGVWAVAPAVNLSGQPSVDPLLQGDLCFQQMQQVKGVTVVPVDRVVTVYAALGIARVQSAEQAALVCDLLGADGLLVPTVTAWEPYNPPKMGGSLQLFLKPAGFARDKSVDPRELARRAAPVAGAPLPAGERAGFVQAVGMFDAADGTTRDSLRRYAYGRHDPAGAWAKQGGEKEFMVNSDRYSAFVWRRLTEQLLDQLYQRVTSPAQQAPPPAGSAIPAAGATAPSAGGTPPPVGGTTPPAGSSTP